MTGRPWRPGSAVPRKPWPYPANAVPSGCVVSVPSTSDFLSRSVVVIRTAHIGVIRQSQFGLLGENGLTIEPLLKNRRHRAVAMGADGQCSFARRLHARLSVVTGQTHQAQTGAIALFRMLLLHQ